MTPISTRLAEILAPYAYQELKIRNLGILYEVTDYVEPVALMFDKIFTDLGGTVQLISPFLPGETDFRTYLTKIAQKKIDAIYVGTQAPDLMAVILKQIKSLGLNIVIIGNDQVGTSLNLSNKSDVSIFEDVYFAEGACDQSNPRYQSFNKLYKKTYPKDSTLFSCYTPESYDAVLVLAEALKNCGEDNKCIKKFLYSITDYPGVSGKINFDSNGDNHRPYVAKVIRNAQIENLITE